MLLYSNLSKLKARLEHDIFSRISAAHSIGYCARLVDQCRVVVIVIFCGEFGEAQELDQNRTTEFQSKMSRSPQRFQPDRGEAHVSGDTRPEEPNLAARQEQHVRAAHESVSVVDRGECEPARARVALSVLRVDALHSRRVRSRQFDALSTSPRLQLLHVQLPRARLEEHPPEAATNRGANERPDDQSCLHQALYRVCVVFQARFLHATCASQSDEQSDHDRLSEFQRRASRRSEVAKRRLVHRYRHAHSFLVG